jgi:hypothetical protein
MIFWHKTFYEISKSKHQTKDKNPGLKNGD